MKIQTVFGNPRKIKRIKKRENPCGRKRIKKKANPKGADWGSGIFGDWEKQHSAPKKSKTNIDKLAAEILRKEKTAAADAEERKAAEAKVAAIKAARKAKEAAQKEAAKARATVGKAAGKVASIEAQLSRGSIPKAMRDKLYAQLRDAKNAARREILKAAKKTAGKGMSAADLSNEIKDSKARIAATIASIGKKSRKKKKSSRKGAAKVASSRKKRARKGATTMAKKGKKRQTRTKRKSYKRASSVKFAASKRQSYRGKRYLPVVYKGDKIAVAHKGGLGLVTRTNPFGSLAFGESTISFGDWFDLGTTKSELVAIGIAGVLAPMVPALVARAPWLGKAQAALGAWSVPATLIVVGSVVNAKVANETGRNVGKAMVTIGLFKAVSNIVAKFTGGKGVSGVMGDLLGYEGYEGYEGDEVSEIEGEAYGEEYGEDLSGGVQNEPACGEQQMGAVDFTPRHMGMIPEGMHGVDFTPRSQVRPFGEIPAGLHGRDGADFGRDGADFGDDGAAGAMA